MPGEVSEDDAGLSAHVLSPDGRSRETGYVVVRVPAMAAPKGFVHVRKPPSGPVRLLPCSRVEVYD